jgi:hypothetical protein|tara:strand:- start:2812 stop:5928 length:3117 start_codon:yes stop_codon:yes gene_type:complete
MVVIFSDLHLSPKTLDTCLAVLRRVHAEAVRRKCPVYFLGDFFDTVYNKGTLPVDVLNILLRYFSSEWTVPMKMLVGNHDMFDAAETVHGLDFLPHANSNITVINKPVRVGDELWVPWRRSTDTIQEILTEHAPGAKVIFGHFDIVGFRMSASRVSTEGVDSSVFPAGVPVYSGHYHTAQTHGCIQYIGSPYQLTLSEAGDRKQLLVLDDTYGVAESILLDIGPRQYKWNASDLMARASELRADDRVAVTMGEPDGATSRLVQTLEDRGVNVVLKKVTPVAAPRIQDVEAMAPVVLFEAWAQHQSIDMASQAWLAARDWLSTRRKGELSVRRVVPERITLSGFGPFLGPLTLPLTSHGLTLVTGQNDGSESSNGAGKSLMTAGALLWALTGVTDGRASLIFGDGRSSVVNATVGRATVEVFGTVDGVTWSVCRTLDTSHRRKHELKLTIDNEDRTKATLAATQQSIAEDVFGIRDASGSALGAWLLRNSVWSQSSVSRWLDASDTQAKTEIRHVTDMSVWEEMCTWSREARKASVTRQATAEHDRASRQRAKQVLDGELQSARRASTEWSASHAVHTLRSLAELEKARASVSSIEAVGDEAKAVDVQEVERLKTTDDTLRLTCLRQKDVLDAMLQGIPAVIRKKTPDELSRALAAVNASEEPDVPGLKSCVDQAVAAQLSRREKLRQAQNALQTFIRDGQCQMCQRPFGDEAHQKTHTIALRTTVEGAQEALLKAVTLQAKAKAEHICASELQKQRQGSIAHLEAMCRYHALFKQHNKDTLARSDAHTKYTDAATAQQQYEMHARTRKLQQVAQRALEQREQAYRRLASQICPHASRVERLRSDVSVAERELAAVDVRLQDEHNAVAQWASISMWSGPRGVQTYAMECAVQRLAASTTKWLRRLFDTDDICMSVSFDDKERLQRFFTWSGHAGVLSGGQWRRAQLASFMAWREMAPHPFPLLVMDEACTAMDKEGIDAVQQALRDWCDEDTGRTCFVITHEPGQHRDTSIYDNHTKIVNKRGRAAVLDLRSTKKQRLH